MSSEFLLPIENLEEKYSREDEICKAVKKIMLPHDEWTPSEDPHSTFENISHTILPGDVIALESERSRSVGLLAIDDRHFRVIWALSGNKLYKPIDPTLHDSYLDVQASYFSDYKGDKIRLSAERALREVHPDIDVHFDHMVHYTERRTHVYWVQHDYREVLKRKRICEGIANALDVYGLSILAGEYVFSQIFNQPIESLRIKNLNALNIHVLAIVLLAEPFRQKAKEAEKKAHEMRAQLAGTLTWIHPNLRDYFR